MSVQNHKDIGYMPDEMFFVPGGQSLRRGKRRERRTPACRPCWVWPRDAAELRNRGVVMDINPHGLAVRMVESYPAGTEIVVQLMRDEHYQTPLSKPMEGTVVRNAETHDGLVDHGVQLSQPEIRRPEPKPIRIDTRPTAPRRPSRMYSLDVTIGNQGIRRNR